MKKPSDLTLEERLKILNRLKQTEDNDIPFVPWEDIHFTDEDKEIDRLMIKGEMNAREIKKRKK